MIVSKDCFSWAVSAGRSSVCKIIQPRAESIVSFFSKSPFSVLVCPQKLTRCSRCVLVLQHVTRGRCGVVSLDLVSWVGMSVCRRLRKGAGDRLPAVTSAGRRYAVS